MTWTADERRGVAKVLLGSWPGTVTAWGQEAFAAYLGELEARGLTAEAVVVAVRSWPSGSDFPPSAPNLAAGARKDPGEPTFDEMCVLVFGPHGCLRARTRISKSWWEPGERERLDEQAIMAHLRTRAHPLVAAFVSVQGVERLRALGLDDEQWGAARRKQLQTAWDEFVEVAERREVDLLVGGRRGELGRFDPAGLIGGL